MLSGLTCFANSGLISGSGFAVANIIGFSFINNISYGFNAPPALTPMNTSAPFNASYSVLKSVSTAHSSFHLFIPSYLPLYITPLVSHIKQFSGRAPYLNINLKQAIPAAPAPLITILHFLISLLVISRALMSPAKHTMAVPC